MTVNDVKKALVEILDASDVPLSAGQVTEKLAYRNHGMARSTVKARLETLVLESELLVEKRTMIRNGRRVYGAVYGTPHTFRVEYDALDLPEDPFAGLVD